MASPVAGARPVPELSEGLGRTPVAGSGNEHRRDAFETVEAS
jgi:hypothetical protein